MECHHRRGGDGARDAGARHRRDVGLTQVMEWGWLETSILLTNTKSVESVHNGIIQYMIERHPELGRKVDVIIPIVGETSDAFLNDVRVMSNTPKEALEAIRKATSGTVEQGSVGGRALTTRRLFDRKPGRLPGA